MAAFRRGALPDAIEGFKSARATYTALGDALKAAEMGNNLSVALLRAGRRREAVAAAAGTPEVFLQAGDEMRAAQAWGNLASAQDACHSRGAADSYHKAADLFRRLGDREGLALVQRDLSAMHLRSGRLREAVACMHEAVGAVPARGVRGRFLHWLLRLPPIRLLLSPRQ